MSRFHSTQPPVRLGDLLAGAEGTELAHLRVRSCSDDSRACEPGDVFVAVEGGKADGRDFAREAVARGAAVVVSECPRSLDAPVCVVGDAREALGEICQALAGHPSRRLKLVGVTGTNGKTTTAHLIASVFQAAGCRTGLLGTLGYDDTLERQAASLTTPAAPELAGCLARMVAHGCSHAVMEVSSHALVMGRVDAVVFDVACFTNLGRDHLDFHADVEEYFQAKASLFTPARARRGLVNIDDEYGRRLAEEATVPVRTYSTTSDAADWWVDDVVVEPTGSSFVVHTPTGDAVPARVPLTGGYNVSNALCAIAALGEAGYDPGLVAEGMAASAGVPGRRRQTRRPVPQGERPPPWI